MVSLLDIHATPLSSYPGPPLLEILEAGTGHGGLTLYLAKAIHAANALRPRSDSSSNEAVKDSQLPSCPPNRVSSFERPSAQDNHQESPSQPSYDHMNDDRLAVIHTVDISRRHSKHAEKTVKGFRQGIYANDIVFHVGDVSQWIDEQVYKRGLGPDQKAFLSHIVLDMPSSFQHVEKAASVLHTHGHFLAFNPSITQIISLVKTVKQLNLPLVLDSVLELGPNSGGRDWDVRAVIPRAQRGTAQDAAMEDDASRNADKIPDDGSVADLAERNPSDKDNQPIPDQVKEMEMVCRPRVGHRVTGGGFLGVWRKMKH